MSIVGAIGSGLKFAALPAVGAGLIVGVTIVGRRAFLAHKREQEVNALLQAAMDEGYALDEERTS